MLEAFTGRSSAARYVFSAVLGWSILMYTLHSSMMVAATSHCFCELLKWASASRSRPSW